jgi:hypothetical protein
VKDYINSLLARTNVQVQSLTAEKAEETRLQTLVTAGHFNRPVFPVPDSFLSSDVMPMLAETARQESNLRRLDGRVTENGYTFDNEYFSSPDAEILYAMVHRFRPTTIVEVGSGNSTKLARQAIRDASLSTHLVSIDPSPRIEISSIADSVIKQAVESLEPSAIADQLRANDILFVDSSHTLKTGGDVCFLLLEVLPRLKAGVLVHIHDVFCPYDYPREWVVELRRPWNEQYLVQALVSCDHRFEVLWAGYYLQQTLDDFSLHFPRANGRRASSLWLRIRTTTQ